MQGFIRFRGLQRFFICRLFAFRRLAALYGFFIRKGFVIYIGRNSGAIFSALNVLPERFVGLNGS